MLIAVLSIFVLALAAPSVHRLAGRRAGLLLALLPLGLALYFAGFIPRIIDGNAAAASYRWAPSLGVSLSFYLDGLSLLFALLITGIGVLVLSYTGGYMAGRARLGWFYTLLLLFMGSMLGLVLARNALTLFVFWELTSISSYLLIGFDQERAEARAAAQQALLVTNAGAMAMLAGLILLGRVGGSFDLASLPARGDAIRADALYRPILLLVLAGAFTKSAQFPFHFWLPGAMAAPTPVSAYLHSATMVNAGVYLLARLSPTLGGTGAWTVLVTAGGATTMVVGGAVAIFHTDLKRILAYSTVSALGMMVLLLGIGTPVAVTAALAFLMAHALYKGALFMVAGSVDHETGTRDVTLLGGLRRAMPVTAAAAALAAVSAAGFGPVLSFIAKELFLESALAARRAWLPLVIAAVLAGTLFVTAAGLTGVRPFFGRLRPSPRPPHETPPDMWAGPILLAVLGVAFGIVPGLVERPLVAPAAAAVLGRPSGVQLALWHGPGRPLALSALSVILGVGLYLGWEALRRGTPWMDGILGWGPGRIYNLALAGLTAFARAQTRLLQNGYLRVYLIVTILTAVTLGGYTFFSKAGVRLPENPERVWFYQIGVAVLMTLAALTAVMSTSRLAAVAALGVVGYSVALIYILFGAPDLAMTQFMIETLTVMLFVLVFYHLPGLRGLSSALTRARDAVIALAAGGFVTVLVLTATADRVEPRVSAYYAEQALPGGHGHNIVNVILVDFRGLDTLGEITVLSVAAFGVFALLRLRPRTGQAEERRRANGPLSDAEPTAPPPAGDALPLPSAGGEGT